MRNESFTGFFAASCLAVLIAFAGAGGAWSSPSDRAAEPSTPQDSNGLMWVDANAEMEDRIYFNGYLEAAGFGAQPPLTEADRFMPAQYLRFRAQLGYWRDCNGDGFIGNAALGVEEYSATLLPDGSVCPRDSPYVRNDWVTEFLWIGPYANGNEEGYQEDPGIIGLQSGGRGVNDTASHVWADWGRPTDPPAETYTLFPLPRGSLSSWEGHMGYIPRSPAGGVAKHINDTSAGCVLSVCTGFPLGVDYGTLYAIGSDLDKAQVPSPLAMLKRAYNGSDTKHGGSMDCGGPDNPCTGSYAQPMFYLYDCNEDPENLEIPDPHPDDPHRKWDYPLSPAMRPSYHPDGSLDGTIYQATRACDKEGAGNHLLYSNLEGDGGTAGQSLKRAHDEEFFFLTGARLRNEEPLISWIPIDGVDARFGLRGFGSGNVNEIGWVGKDVWTMLPGSGPFYPLHEAYVTFYADVSVQAIGNLPAGSESTALPSGSDPARYGAEWCWDGFGAGLTGGRWDCDPAHWTSNDPRWGVEVGHVVDLRDVDCYDLRVLGSPPLTAMSVCEDWAGSDSSGPLPE